MLLQKLRLNHRLHKIKKKKAFLVDLMRIPTTKVMKLFFVQAVTKHNLLFLMMQ